MTLDATGRRSCGVVRQRTSISASPVPTFPAASVARTIRTCVPGLRSGRRIVIVSRGGVEQPVVGEDRRPVAAVEGVVGLDQPGQLVLER